MIANRGTARMIGALFLISTAAYMTGSGLIDGILGHPEYLSELYPNRIKLYVGVFLELINALDVIGIAIYLFPILKQHSESISLCYLSSRIIESVLLIGSTLGLFILLSLSEQYIAGVEGRRDDYFQTIGQLAMSGQKVAFELAMLFLSIGSILFCYLLYRARLVPQTLSLLGMVGYIALLVSSGLGITGSDRGFVLYIPGGLFELILPLWLIFKGFSATK